MQDGRGSSSTWISEPADLVERAEHVARGSWVRRGVPDAAIVIGAIEDLELLRMEHIFADKLGGLDNAGDASADDEAEAFP